MEPSQRPASQEPKKKSGWKAAGIILMVLAGLMILSALRTLASMSSRGDGAYQAGATIGVFILPAIVALLGYLCLRRAQT